MCPFRIYYMSLNWHSGLMVDWYYQHKTSSVHLYFSSPHSNNLSSNQWRFMSLSPYHWWFFLHMGTLFKCWPFWLTSCIQQAHIILNLFQENLNINFTKMQKMYKGFHEFISLDYNLHQSQILRCVRAESIFHQYHASTYQAWERSLIPTLRYQANKIFWVWDLMSSNDLPTTTTTLGLLHITWQTLIMC